MFRLFRMKKTPEIPDGDPETSATPHPPGWTPGSEGPGPSLDMEFLSGGIDIGLGNRIRTLADKAGLPEDEIEPMVAAYVAAGEQARIEVSQPGQIPGLRRLILLGSLWTQDSPSVTTAFDFGSVTQSRTERQAPTICGITDAGLLFLHRLDRAEPRGDEPRPSWPAGPLTTAQAFRAAMENPGSLSIGGWPSDIGLSRHAAHRATIVEGPAGRMVSAAWNALPPGTRWEIPFSFIRGLGHVTRKTLSRRLALALHAVNEALDPDILRLARGCAIVSLREVAWMCGAVPPKEQGPGPGRILGSPIGDLHDPDLRRARLQAIRSYPAMGKMILKSSELRRVVDSRQPLAPAIAETLGVPVPGVRLLSGLTWQMAGVRPTDPRDGLAQIALIPRDLAPVRRSEFRQIPAITGFQRVFGENLSGVLRRFARGGSPYRFAGELQRIGPGDVMDALSYLSRKLLVPARMHGLRRMCEREDLPPMSVPQRTHGEPLIADLARSLTIRDLFDISDRWHRNISRHDDHLITLRNEDRWAPFLGDVQLSGVTARELRSAEALKIQGRKEGHCVGGYTDQILRGTRKDICLIYSLEAEGAIIGTAQVHLTQKKGSKKAARDASRPEASEPEWTASIVQNRSVRNGPVSAAAERAASSLCRALKTAAPARIDAYVGGLEKIRRRKNGLAALSGRIRDAGYDIWAPGNLERAWDELSVYLPRAVRKAGLDALIERYGRIGGTDADQRPLEMLSICRPGVPAFWVVDQSLVRKALGEIGEDVEVRIDPGVDPEPRPAPAGHVAEEHEWMPF